MDDLKTQLLAVESGRPDSLGIATNWYRNPEGPAALDRIAELEAENASLKARLAMANSLASRMITLALINAATNSPSDPDDPDELLGCTDDFLPGSPADWRAALKRKDH